MRVQQLPMQQPRLRAVSCMSRLLPAVLCQSMRVHRRVHSAQLAPAAGVPRPPPACAHAMPQLQRAARAAPRAACPGSPRAGCRSRMRGCTLEREPRSCCHLGGAPAGAARAGPGRSSNTQCACVCICMCVLMCACVSAYACSCMHVRVRVCTDMCAHVRVCLCVHQAPISGGACANTGAAQASIRRGGRGDRKHMSRRA